MIRFTEMFYSWDMLKKVEFEFENISGRIFTCNQFEFIRIKTWAHNIWSKQVSEASNKGISNR